MMKKLVNDWVAKENYRDDGIVYYGDNVFESEDFTDKLYETFLKFVPKDDKGPLFESSMHGRCKDEFHVGDLAGFMVDGLYLPCDSRAALLETVCLDAFVLPQRFSMWYGDALITVVKINKFPKGVTSVGKAVHKYKLIVSFGLGNFDQTYFGLNAHGDMVYAKIMQHGISVGGNKQRYLGILCLNAYDDKRFLWQVESSEEVLCNRPLTINAGVREEHIKSLMYARTLPVTSTGRKRPILHWVSSHKRRLKEGVDIDIDKYLRGITSFDMHGLKINIVNPVKKSKP